MITEDIETVLSTIHTIMEEEMEEEGKKNCIAA